MAKIDNTANACNDFQYTKHLMYILSFIPHKKALKKILLSHFISEKLRPINLQWLVPVKSITILFNSYKNTVSHLIKVDFGTKTDT